MHFDRFIPVSLLLFKIVLMILIALLIAAPTVFAQNRHMKWRVPTGGTVGAPAIGPDGTIYAGSDDHRLYAVTPGSMKVWTLTAGDSVKSAPAIAPDGTIYVCSQDQNLYAITPEGTLKWTFTAGETLSPPLSPLTARSMSPLTTLPSSTRSIRTEQRNGNSPRVAGR